MLWESVDHRSDFARLARILTGNAIGLVLGGGGARSFLKFICKTYLEIAEVQLMSE